MKKTCLLILAVLLLLALPLPVHADEPARYNFASAQGDKELKIQPGEEGRGCIYFYNIDGNRITHIILEVSGAPSGWEVTIEPLLSEARVLVSGMPVTVEENLYVEPSDLLSEEPQDVPEGMVSIKVPGRGYALGKLAQVLVSVPESASLGTTGEITIAGEAAWLGQGGSAAVKQARDFDFTVTVVSGQTEYTETIIGQGEAPQAPEIPEVIEATPKEITEGSKEITEGQASPASEEILPPAPEPKSAGFSLTRWLPAIIAAVVVILAAILIPLLVRRRR
jgi:hypothetical protein